MYVVSRRRSDEATKKSYGLCMRERMPDYKREKPAQAMPARGGKGFLAFYASPGNTPTGVFHDLTGASRLNVSYPGAFRLSLSLDVRRSTYSRAREGQRER